METFTVDTSQGKLRGKKATSKTGATYFSFQGVPYAKPPVGRLRFKVAEPPEPWFGIRDALKEGDMCTQFSFIDRAFAGSEDCLYLNVYSPQLPEEKEGESLLPVLFVIHGGGFVSGSGNTELHGPDYVVGEGVVIVSPTYRVGVLGFLCLEGPACPGNMGLKDQVAALRWTQQNIAKFGGDPNNVTIMGDSAGAASVQYQMLSPMPKGLFHRAISSSGSVLSPWALTKQPRYQAFRLGSTLGCTNNDPERLVEYLRSVDHMTLVKAITDDVLPEEEKYSLFKPAFTPAVEVHVESVERFLPAHPLQLLDEGRFTSVPLVVGITSEEAMGILAFSGKDILNSEVLAEMDNILDKTILADLRLPETYKDREKIVSKIRSFYLKDKPLSVETLPGLISLQSDLMFCEGVNYFVKKVMEHSKVPLYQYCFSHEGMLSMKINPRSPIKLDIPGACHGDDYLHLFDTKLVDSTVPPESPEARTRARLVKMFTNFAKTGNPTPDMTSLVPLTWQPYTASNPLYLNIDKELSLESGLFRDRMAFWQELYTSSRM